MKPGNPEFSLFLNTIPVGICFVDADMIVSLWNQTLVTWTGISAERAVGTLVGRLVPAFDTPLIRDRLLVAYSGGGPVILSSRFHPHLLPHSDELIGEGIFQRTTIIPFYEDNQASGALIVVEDVTAISEQVITYRTIKEQIKSELEERRKAEQALGTANKKLNTLASITRHDLQNLLTAFEGYLILALSDNPGGKLQAYLEKMKSISSTMKKQVAFTRDYQDMGIHAPGWFRIDHLVRSAAQGSYFSGIEIDIRTGTLSVLGDPLIEKAFYNLMENAVRHGDHTTVISVSYEQDIHDIHIIIADNGAGIPDKIKPRIFERGFGKNTGLGLFLTAEILTITGLRITENGREGEGARFVITVPLGQYRFDNTN